MAFYDFLISHPDYLDNPRTVSRMNHRYRFLIRPYRAELKQAKVLDLGAHDGRWSYALAAEGATVHGVEGRQNLIDKFSLFPDCPFKRKVTLEQGDFFKVLERLIYQGETYDIIVAFGIYYHITDHYRLLAMMHQLEPKLIIIDGMFTMAKGASVTFGIEDTSKDLNSIERVQGQRKTMVGTPSRRWMDNAAGTLGYQTKWADWTSIPPNDRLGIRDYYTAPPKRRGTVALRPKQAED